MTGNQKRGIWESSSAYERYVGRWSRLLAREFLEWLSIPPSARWLDVGCGTGVLSQTILDQTSPVEVFGVDPSDSFISQANQQVRDTRARFEVGDAQSLSLDTGVYDAVVSGLAINFIPDIQAGLSEMVRVTVSGGTVAAYVFDYADKIELMRYFWDAAIALNPQAAELDEGRLFPICQPEPLKDLFEMVELEDVEVINIDVPTHFQDFDDYWSPFLGGVGPAPAYAMSLSEEARIALRERIRASLPISKDGSIPLIARGWAVRGNKYKA